MSVLGVGTKVSECSIEKGGVGELVGRRVQRGRPERGGGSKGWGHEQRWPHRSSSVMMMNSHTVIIGMCVNR